MAYTVLARRLRPQGFEEVVGQAHVTRTLSNELRSGQIGHAFLFSGSRGVGKTTTARILAKALNCEKGPTPTPCGECESCQAVSVGQAVDVIEIDGASNRGIDEIRDLRENVRYAPVSSRFKIFIIDEVHMLTKEAFNALLKTLEEPPERVKFILATTESHKVPPTIRSRCQHFDFRLVPSETLLKTLEFIGGKEGLKLSQKSLRLVAMAGRGSVRDALSLLEQVLAFAGPDAPEEDVASILGIARLEVFHSLIDGILAQDVELLLRVTERLLESGYDLYQIAQAFLDYLRDLSVLCAAPQAGGLVDRAPDEIPRLQAYAKKLDLDTLLRYFQVVQQTAEKMRVSTYPRPLFEMMLVGLSRIRALQPVADLARRLGELEQSLRPLTPRKPDPGSPEGPRPSGGGPGGSASWAGGGQTSRPVERPPPAPPMRSASPPVPSASPPVPSASPPVPSAGEEAGSARTRQRAEGPLAREAQQSYAPELVSLLEPFAKVCARLAASNAPRTLQTLVRAAGVRKLGAETLLVLDAAQPFARKHLEEARARSVLEEALAAELGLPRVRVSFETAPAGSFDNLQARDTVARKAQEALWLGMARSIDGVKLALEVFGGRIQSFTVLEEDGETNIVV